MGFTQDHKKEIDVLFEILKTHVKEKFNVDVNSISEVISNSRKRPFVYFRKMLMVILGETFNNKYSQEEIAGVVDLDRTSFIYHSKTHLNHYTSYPEYREEYDEIRNKFTSEIKSF